MLPILCRVKELLAVNPELFDTALSLGTGDEIEELESSFVIGMGMALGVHGNGAIGVSEVSSPGEEHLEADFVAIGEPGASVPQGVGALFVGDKKGLPHACATFQVVRTWGGCGFSQS